MTRVFRFATVAAVMAVLAVVVFSRATPAQAPLGGDSISVGGEAEIRVVPDEVILTLGVETFDRLLKSAKNDNDERIKGATAAAKARGIPADAIQTDYIGIQPERGPRPAFVIDGYFVRKTVVIRLKDLQQFEGLLTDALDAGVTNVQSIDFQTTELRKHRDEARTLAIRAAQDKAQLLAAQTGRHVGVVTSISEAAYGYWSSYGSWWGGRNGYASQNVVQSIGGAPAADDSTLAPGQISIRASVSLTLRLN